MRLLRVFFIVWMRLVRLDTDLSGIFLNVRAMQYPLPIKEQGRYMIGLMKCLADSITYPPLNECSDHLEDKLIPYYYKARKGSGLCYFKGVREAISKRPKGDFYVAENGADADYVKAGAGAISGGVTKSLVRVFVDYLKNSTKKGWKMMKENDSYSVRAYTANLHIFPTTS